MFEVGATCLNHLIYMQGVASALLTWVHILFWEILHFAHVQSAMLFLIALSQAGFGRWRKNKIRVIIKVCTLYVCFFLGSVTLP